MVTPSSLLTDIDPQGRGSMEISSKFVAAGAGEQEEGWREQRKLFRWLLFSGIALMLAIAIGTAVAVDSFRRAAIDNGKQRLESAVLLLARHFDQQFGDFSVLQSEVILHLQSYGIASAEIFRGEAGTLALHEVLRTKVSGWTDVAGV